MTAALDHTAQCSGIAVLIGELGPSAYAELRAWYPHVGDETVAQLIEDVNEHYYKASVWRDDPDHAAFRWSDDRPTPGQLYTHGDQQADEETARGDKLIAEFVTAALAGRRHLSVVAS
jgi:hypothetical protein